MEEEEVEIVEGVIGDKGRPSVVSRAVDVVGHDDEQLQFLCGHGAGGAGGNRRPSPLGDC